MTVNEQISKDVTTDLCYYVVGKTSLLNDQNHWQILFDSSLLFHILICHVFINCYYQTLPKALIIHCK